MGLMAEFLPIIIFFGAYKWQGIMAATLSAIIATLMILIINKVKTGQYKNMQVVSFFSLLVLGGLALVSKKEIFIKLKPTVIYWLLAASFLITHFFGDKLLIEKIGNSSVELPKKIWQKLSILWIMFFFIMGCINIYVVYCFDTNTWVNFKLFGTLGLTALFVIPQSVFIYKYLDKYSDLENLE
jgi:intracellular septation protein